MANFACAHGYLAQRVFAAIDLIAAGNFVAAAPNVVTALFQPFLFAARR
ncbi:hypothetical protein ABQF17_01545 [Mycolicibacterium elephantis]|nr:hypothetical protein [Mycolicibacterium elephantis]